LWIVLGASVFDAAVLYPERPHLPLLPRPSLLPVVFSIRADGVAALGGTFLRENPALPGGDGKKGLAAADSRHGCAYFVENERAGSGQTCHESEDLYSEVRLDRLRTISASLGDAPSLASLPSLCTLGPSYSSSTLHSSATYSFDPSSLPSSASVAWSCRGRKSAMDKGPEERSRLLVRTLGCVLQKLLDVNKRGETAEGDGNSPTITKFHASRPPSISVAEYLERINKYASCSSECLVLALIYIDRLIQQSNFALTALNVHRVLITAVMLAAKFFDDQYFNNLYYAKVGGVPCKEINALEVEFLFLTNFSLHVTEDVFFRYFHELMNHAAHAACPSCCPRFASSGSKMNLGSGSMAGVTGTTGGGLGGVGRVPSPVFVDGGWLVNRGMGGGRSVSPGMVVTPPLSHRQHLQQQQLVHEQQQEQRRLVLSGGKAGMAGEAQQPMSVDQRQRHFTSYFSFENGPVPGAYPGSAASLAGHKVSDGFQTSPSCHRPVLQPHEQAPHFQYPHVLYAPVPVSCKPPPRLLVSHAPAFYSSHSSNSSSSAVSPAEACGDAGDVLCWGEGVSRPAYYGQECQHGPCNASLASEVASGTCNSRGAGVGSSLQGVGSGFERSVSLESAGNGTAAAAAVARQEHHQRMAGRGGSGAGVAGKCLGTQTRLHHYRPQQHQHQHQQLQSPFYPTHYAPVQQQQQQQQRLQHHYNSAAGGMGAGVGLGSRASMCAHSYFQGVQVLMNS